MRTSFARRIAVATALVFVSSTAFVAQHVFADVSGTWKVAISMPDQSMQSTLVLKQAGDSLTGTIDGDMIGSRAITGTVKGDTVRFGFMIDMQGNVLDIRVGGLLKDKDTLEGEVALPGGMGAMPFAAKRQP